MEHKDHYDSSIQCSYRDLEVAHPTVMSMVIKKSSRTAVVVTCSITYLSEPHHTGSTAKYVFSLA